MSAVVWRRFTSKKKPSVDRDQTQHPSVQATSTDQVNLLVHSRPSSSSYYLRAARDPTYSRPMSASSSRPTSSHTSRSEYRDFQYQSLGGIRSQDSRDELSDAAGEPLASDRAIDLIPRSAKPLISKTARRQSLGESSAIKKPPSTTLNHTTFDHDSRRASAPNPRPGGLTTNKSNSLRMPVTAPYETTISSSASTSPREASSADSIMSHDSADTTASSVRTLPPLQAKSGAEETDGLDPILEDDPKSFDLVSGPLEAEKRGFSLVQRSEQMFSSEHLEEIFADPATMLGFTTFLSTCRPDSVPLLIYYLDALKALKAIKYANAVAEALMPIEGKSFTETTVQNTVNVALENRTREAFNTLVRDDLPAYIAHVFIQVVSLSIQRRVTGTLPPHLREASEGLAEVFCLTDPSRADNPIVFASEEFHRTTQYGVDYAIGRNCRFLQGPQTNPNSVRRLSEAIAAGKEVSEVFLNYRRDGSPFMNLLMVAPLLDSRGNVRYFIGAQVDVSGLCKESTELDALQRLLKRKAESADAKAEVPNGQVAAEDKGGSEEFQELSEMFNATEIDVVRRCGGRMHGDRVDPADDANSVSQRPRLLLRETSDAYKTKIYRDLNMANGKLEGIYQNYLLVRPYPSLRILFASPALRVPGILQSEFLSRIGGSLRVRDSLKKALASGRGVTAKVRWLCGRLTEEEGRGRWIHCTPLLGRNGAVGVWMVVLVDEENAPPSSRRFMLAPPVAASIGPSAENSPVLSAFGGGTRGRMSSMSTAGGGNESITSFAL